MNPILAYEQGYISFKELEDCLWDSTTNQIYEVGEKCFAFYCGKANSCHRCTSNRFAKYSYYIRNYGSDLWSESEWYCD